MAKLETFIKAVRHDFTREEKEKISDDQSRLLTEIAETKTQAKNIASQYASKIKTLEGELGQKTHKHVSGYELRDKLCYLRKNYETKQREYIEVESGKVVYTEPFFPSDHRKQHELQEEFINAGLGKAKYLGMKFFYEKCYEYATSEEYIDRTMQEVIDEKGNAVMSFCANYLINEKGVLTIQDEVEFDSVFETLREWFAEFVDKGVVEPVKSDYPEFEESEVEPPVEDPNVPLDEPQQPSEKPAKKKAAKKKGAVSEDEQNTNGIEPKKDNEGEDGEETQTPWNHL